MRIDSHGACVERLVRVLPFLVLASVAFRVFVPPLVGVADNGDGYRVMSSAGIVHTPALGADRHRRVRPTYVVREVHLALPPSSGAAMATLARLVPIPGTPPDRFDLRAMGVVYLAVVACAVRLAQRFRTPPLRTSVFTFVFASPFYADFVMSFYGDAAAVVGVLGLALVLDHRGGASTPSRWPSGDEVAVLFFASLVGLANRMHAIVPAIVLFAVLASPLRRTRSRAFYVLAFALAVGAPLHHERGPGFRFPEINGYHRVYRGIALYADDRSEVLEALELPVWSSRLIGTSYFDAPVAPTLARSLADVSPLHTLGLYLSRPTAMGRVVSRVLDALTGRVPIGLGHDAVTYHVSTPRFEEPRWTWHAMRVRVSSHPLFVALIIICALAVQAIQRVPETETLTFLVACVLASSAAVVLGDGTFALARHLLLASFALDLLIACLLLSLGRTLAQVIERRRAAPEISRASPGSTA